MDDLLQVVTAQAIEITELKAELVERRDQYRAVIEHNPHPTWVFSLESLRFLDVNDVALRSYGWTRDEFLSMTIVDIRPREDVPALLANMTRMRQRLGGVSGPWRHRHKDGRVVDVTVSFLTLPWCGRPARLVIAEPSSAGRVASEPASALSRREHQVLHLVAHGYTSQQIAEKLALSPKSVETYRARFTRKLGLSTRAEIVQYAITHGILAA